MSEELLRRFWFTTENSLGIGATAYSIDDAKELINDSDICSKANIVSVTEDVDVRSLDQNHVMPNMGPPNFRGIWFPNLIIK